MIVTAITSAINIVQNLLISLRMSSLFLAWISEVSSLFIVEISFLSTTFLWIALPVNLKHELLSMRRSMSQDQCQAESY